MPELPEVEVLVRSLGPRLQGKVIREVRVLRPKIASPSTTRQLAEALAGCKFQETTRRGKYLIFNIATPASPTPRRLLGHLGMTGRMYLQPASAPLPKHAAAVISLGTEVMVFEDTRYFGRLTLDLSPLDQLGPEPLGEEFTPEHLVAALRRFAQPVKVKLLDQSLVAGIGNIYASEALFRAGISPRRAARRVRAKEIEPLWRAIREVLSEAIAWGSTLPALAERPGGGPRLLVQDAEPGEYATERLLVYDRAGQACANCATPIRHCVQAARSTYFCPKCQR